MGERKLVTDEGTEADHGLRHGKHGSTDSGRRRLPLPRLREGRGEGRQRILNAEYTELATDEGTDGTEARIPGGVDSLSQGWERGGVRAGNGLGHGKHGSADSGGEDSLSQGWERGGVRAGAVHGF